MKTIYSISFVLLVLVGSSFKTQESKEVKIKEAGLIMSLPNDKWEEYKDKKAPRPTYHFVRTDVKTSTGKKLVPEVVITVEPVNSYTDLTKYSIQKQKHYSASLQDFKVEKVFTESDGMMKLRYAIGNKARYTDADGIKHTFYFIHAVRKATGIQILIDVPSYLFDSYEEELTSIIRSFDYKQ